MPAVGRRGAFDPHLAGFGYLVERRIDLRLFCIYVGLAWPGDCGVEAQKNEKEGGDNAVKFHREPRARIFLKSLLDGPRIEVGGQTEQPPPTPKLDVTPFN